MDPAELLRALHGLLAQDLTNRLKNGEVSKDGELMPVAPATLNVIRQFLRDNNIDALPAQGSPLSDLIGSLPDDFEEFEDPENNQH